VNGRRGVRGGYKLARPAAEISLLSVARAVSAVDRINECPLGLLSHGPNLCPLHRTMDCAAKMVIELLEERTLEDLVVEEGAPKPLCDAEVLSQLTVSAGVAKQ
jgi:DNA-binding IscR family transcriptional regulator